ncbi:Receptor kinase-like protein Xa21 [Euphorbia peplus]|nr:Receptor kinase-like protein Xa21 [Euphorbia peplus]
MCLDEIAAKNISTDEDALLALKAHIINDPQNLLASNWSKDTSVCDWIGITCGTRHRRVRGIRLRNMSLTGTIPPDVGNLSFLVNFSLYSNHFYGFLPDQLGNLRRLRRLDLGYNLFDGIIPSWIGSFTQLQYLDLYSNNFRGMIPISVCNLSKLNHLYLGINNLEGEIPKAIGNLQNLKILSLENSKLSGGSIPTTTTLFRNMSSLRVLDISRNNLTGHIPEAIGNLQRLEILDLFNNKLSGGLPIGISNISSLQKLDVSTNTLTGYLPSNMFAHLPALESFSLSMNLFSGPIPSSLFTCKRLRMLNLEGNQFVGDLHEDFGNLTMLQQLYLGFNNFKGEIPKLIGNLKSMEVLNIRRTSIGGKIPSSIGNLTQLRSFDVSENMLKGIIPFEMAKLIGEDQSFIQTMTLATVGYMAPEYGSEGLVSVKGDMYSFGILLMETFTRKRPTDEIFNEEMSIKQWIEYLLPSGVAELADPNLISVNEQHYEAKTDCISSIMDLALKCCVDVPEERISSKEAASALNKIKVKLFNGFNSIYE